MEAQISNVNVIGVSGVNETKLLQGHPYGGCAFVCHKSFNCTLALLDTTNRRLFACIINLSNNLKILEFNIYMPCDTVCDESNPCTYQDVLIEVKFLMSLHNGINHVVVCGDMNSDVSRQHLPHTIALQEFCELESFQLCIMGKSLNVDYTYENVATGECSTLDHFMVSDNLHRSITEYFR